METNLSCRPEVWTIQMKQEAFGQLNEYKSILAQVHLNWLLASSCVLHQKPMQ